MVGTAPSGVENYFDAASSKRLTPSSPDGGGDVTRFWGGTLRWLDIGVRAWGDDRHGLS